MTPPATTTAWAIKAPDGSLNKIYSEPNDYSKLYFEKPLFRISEGYRCVRVKIEEVAE